MFFLRSLLLLLSVFSLAGCAVKYCKRIPGFQPGYTDRRLGVSTYQVQIGEAWPQDWPDLEKFAIYRAADITEANAKRYFKVLDASSQINTAYITTPSTTTFSASGYRYGNTAFVNGTSTTMPGVTAPISGGWYTLDFEILSDNEALKEGSVIDSQKVKRDLSYFINSRR